MSNLIQCDVKGCNTTDRHSGSYGVDVPAGWRALAEVRMQKPRSLVHGADSANGAPHEALRQVAANVAGNLGLPPEVTASALDSMFAPATYEPVATPILVTFHICPFHELPTMKELQGVPSPAPLHDISTGA